MNSHTSLLLICLFKMKVFLYFLAIQPSTHPFSFFLPHTCACQFLNSTCQNSVCRLCSKCALQTVPVQHLAVLSPVQAHSCASVLGLRCAPLLQEEALWCYCRKCRAGSVLGKKLRSSAMVFTDLSPSERSSAWTAGDVRCGGEGVSWRELWRSGSVSYCINDAGDVAEVGLGYVLPWPILNIMTSGPLPKLPELDRLQKKKSNMREEKFPSTVVLLCPRFLFGIHFLTLAYTLFCRSHSGYLHFLSFWCKMTLSGGRKNQQTEAGLERKM